MKETTTRWHSMANVDDLVEQAARRILKQADAAIDRQGRFSLVLAGGSTPRPVYERLRTASADWAAWHIFFGDERCVEEGSPERNSVMAHDAWLAHVRIPDEQIHVIPAEQGAYKAANAYARTLKGHGDFDMVLLGLGEDGHAASLFPGQYWGIEHDSRFVLPVFKAPKPPPERVTLSANRLSRAACVLFLVDGESKRDAVQRWREGGSMPAAAITPGNGVDVLVQADLL